MLDFAAGVVRQSQDTVSSVGLQLLGDEVLQNRHMVQAHRNMRSVAGIVIREPECPLRSGPSRSHTSASVDFKGKGKAKLDYESTMDFRLACM